METIFRVNEADFNENLLNIIKTLFKKKDIEISVSDEINDETNFLLKNPENKAHLLEAIEEIKQNKNLVRFTGKEFEKYSKKLLKK